MSRFTEWALQTFGSKSALTQPPFWHRGAQAFWGMGMTNGREIAENDYDAYVSEIYKANGPVFSCILNRLMIYSEARFQFQKFEQGRTGDLHDSPELEILSNPWPGGTTGDLLARMETDLSLAGNSYHTRIDDSSLPSGSTEDGTFSPGSGRFGKRATGPGSRIVRMPPNKVDIIINSPNGDPNALDSKVVGYMYRPTIPGEQVILLAEDVAHYTMVPDPAARYRGMSWITTVLNEIDADQQGIIHKGKFLRNGATLGHVVRFADTVGQDDFDAFVRKFKDEHQSAENAYKTLFLGGGADLSTVGTDLRQLDFARTQGQGETRIAAASGVPPVIVGLSEGLQAATYSNYGQARRRFADGTLRPLWRQTAGALSKLVNVPSGSRLWYDDRDIAFLSEDRKDIAEIMNVHATAAKQLVDSGFTPESIIAALQAEDLSMLKHSGLVSVQLFPPGTLATPAGARPEHQAAGNAEGGSPGKPKPESGKPEKEKPSGA